MKPPITENLPQFRATDEEIQALIKVRHLDEKGMSLAEQRMTAMTIILITGVATAQRDADEVLMKQEGIRVAREIFGEIEKHSDTYDVQDQFASMQWMYLRMTKKDWESLKSKYTGGQKCERR